MHRLISAFVDRSLDLSHVMRKPAFCIYAKTKVQITTQLISTFVFATKLVQSLFFLNRKFQVSSCLLWLYSQVCVRPGPKPRRQVFSQRDSYYSKACLFLKLSSLVGAIPGCKTEKRFSHNKAHILCCQTGYF